MGYYIKLLQDTGYYDYDYDNAFDYADDRLTARQHDRHGDGINPDLWEALVEIAEDVGTANDQLAIEELNTLAPPDLADTVLTIIGDVLWSAKHSANYDSIDWVELPLSNSDLVRLYDASLHYVDHSLGIHDSARDLAVVASVLMGRPFSSGVTYGSGQSDWLEYICPAEIDWDVRYGERHAMIWGEGTTVAFYEDRDRRPDDKDCPDFYCLAPFFDNEVDNIKKWAANYVGAPIDEVEAL